MAAVTKVTYKGKEIVYIDYTQCASSEEMIEAINEAKELVKKENKDYLQLSNISGATITPDFLIAAKNAAKYNPKLAKKRAIVGLDKPAQKLFLKVYNTALGSLNELKSFDSIEEAKEWLVDEN